MILHKVERRMDEVGRHIYSNLTPIDDIAMRETMDHEPVREAMAAKNYKPAKVGKRWGKEWGSSWWRFRFTVPKSFKGRTVVALLDTDGECCCFMDGVPLQGLDRNRDDIVLLKSAKGGEKFELFVEAGANNAFGGFPGNNELKLKRAEIATFNPEVWDYYHDLLTLTDLAKNLPENSVRRQKIVYECNNSVDAFDFHHTDDETLKQSARTAARIVAPLLKCRASDSMPTVSCSGHAHIDVAWLWPLAESIRKCSRTFSSVVKYMEDYPDYRFTQSQAELYMMTREHYPDLYDRIKKCVKAGQWEVMTGMWVESDCNVTSGESLVRQILYGKNFAREEFGKEVDVLWLPDVFGYSAALPQILRKAGIHYFATIKIHWNEVNKFPYTSFVWEGIDGSEVLSHFPPTGGYNENLRPERLLREVDGMHEKGHSDHAFMAFGWGDGGGGPTKVMLEHAKRMKDLEGLPKSKQQFLNDFFRELEEERDTLPRWVGELYLETHRKTYTSQADNKKNNRRSELLYRDAEFHAAMAALFGYEYPKERFDANWKRILVNQFHDILPGSSIKEVYEDSDVEYERILTEGEELRDAAGDALAHNIDLGGEGDPVVVFNTLSWARDGLVEIDYKGSAKVHVADADGRVMHAEKAGNKLRFHAQFVPPMGHAVYYIREGARDAKTDLTEPTEKKLENFFWRMEFDANGNIKRLYDKVAKREVLPKGARANVFQVFEDKPNTFPAWNIDQYYEAKGFEVTKADSIEVGQKSELKTSVRIKRSFSNTTIEQEIVLYDHMPRIDFVTHIDWHERDYFMKVAFPVEVRAPRATYEIQYGHVERPTHRNTSWDAAKFEGCAQKWMDLSEPGYGVALLNDSKYGHDCHGNVMRLTLVAGPREPDPDCDEGPHDFVYSLLPHTGDLREAGVIQEAYELNVPLRAVPVERKAVGKAKGAKGKSGKQQEAVLPPFFSWFDVSGSEEESDEDSHVIIEAVKREYSGDRIIVRLYESEGRRGKVALTTDMLVRKVHEVNLMEENLEEMTVKDGTIEFEVSPFEIRTFAFTLKR